MGKRRSGRVAPVLFRSIPGSALCDTSRRAEASYIARVEEDAMGFAYKLLYGVGFTPWEQMARSLLITEQISGLFDREEAGREPPYGRALDLGCGSGIWAVKLAARGWQVAGVDFVPKALRRAREQAEEAGVELELIEGDVTAVERHVGSARGGLLTTSSVGIAGLAAVG